MELQKVIKWSYYSNGVVITEESCPDKPDLKVYLPDTLDMIFYLQKLHTNAENFTFVK